MPDKKRKIQMKRFMHTSGPFDPILGEGELAILGYNELRIGDGVVEGGHLVAGGTVTENLTVECTALSAGFTPRGRFGTPAGDQSIDLYKGDGNPDNANDEDLYTSKAYWLKNELGATAAISLPSWAFHLDGKTIYVHQIVEGAPDVVIHWWYWGSQKQITLTDAQPIMFVHLGGGWNAFTPAV